MEKHLVRIDVEYLGDLHCKVVHGPTGQSFITDAPVDNNGKGEFISPTDLAAASIASCVATIMGIVAVNHQIDLKGLRIEAVKEMVTQPVRRIGTITLEIFFPRKYSEKEYKLLKNVVNVCPVTKSISSEVAIIANFHE